MEFILKSALLIGIIYSFYKIFLQKETFFKSIRVYFIIGLLVTVILPLLIIPIYIEVVQVVSTIPEITETAYIETEVFTETVATIIKKPFNWFNLFTTIYFIGFTFFCIKFIIEIVSLYKLIHQSNKLKNGKITFVETIKSISPFSIFNYIVYNKNQFSKTELAQIITHEKVHVKQLHTYDMFLVHILVIVQWFNPFAWLYKKELTQNLEFLADKYAQNTSTGSVRDIETLKEYQYLLLKTSIKKNPFALSTNFYNSLIKKRIIMLQKTPSKKLNQLKYVLVIPILVLFLYAFNTKEVIKPVYENLFSNLATIEEKKLIVIDVSHGGKDSGAKVENILEKDIVFKISQKIKSLYKGEHSLVFTREKDEFISLADRVDKINNLNPDLVISLHVSSMGKDIEPNGLVAYASEENIAFEKSKRIANKLLNAVASKDLKIKGFSKGNLTIIKKVNSPAVLLELGFISNKKDRDYINSEKGQTKIAKSIINFLDGNIASSKKINFINPIYKENVNRISSGFGMRNHPVLKTKKFHNGIDIIAHNGTDVYATANGIVIKATYDELKGNYIQIKHANGYQTNYHHLGKIQITLDEQVKTGDIISTVGNSGKSTGPHLHYEVIKDGKNVNPKPFLNYAIVAKKNTFTKQKQEEKKVIEVPINKSTTEKQLNKIKKELKAEGITINFKKVKRNKNGEIISIKIDAKSENSSVSYSSTDDDGIKEIILKLEDDSISIGNANAHSMHFTHKDGVSYFVSDKKHKKHKKYKKHKTKAFHFKSDDNSHDHDNNIFIIDVNDDMKDSIFIVNGKKMTKEAFEKMDKNDIKTIEIESDSKNIFIDSKGKSKHIKIITENEEEDENGKKIKKEIKIIKSDDGDSNSFFYEIEDNDDENTITTYKVNGKKMTKAEFEKFDKSKIKNLKVSKEKKVEKKE